MASVFDRLTRIFKPETQKAGLTRAPYATRVGQATLIQNNINVGRRSVRLLRHFADHNEALRTAITWRKQQVSESRWRIVRMDDPTKPPDPKVVKNATQLFRYVNRKRESMRSLLDQVVEDVLVVDAGCIEKVKTLGAPSKRTGCVIDELIAVDGSTIGIDPNWDGSDENAIRYRQYLDGQVVAQLRNDQMLYIMQNQTTHRVLGWSQVETLVNIIEAELYGEKYDYDMLRQAAPAGIIDLGTGLNAQQVEAFRDYYQKEIAGSKDVAIFGGGDVGPGGGVKFTKFGYSPNEMQRTEYKEWLIKKIAFVFQCDPTIFGITGDVNKASAKVVTVRTDQGFVALARLVAEYITREIIWEIDEDHGFEFTDLTARDPLLQAKIDQLYSQIGVTFPNEIRAREGYPDPVDWGDKPYNASGTPTPDPLEDDDESEDDENPKDDDAKHDEEK